MQPMDLRGLTASFTVGGLAAGTTTTLSTANTLFYSINGKAYTKTAVTNGATPTSDAATGNAFLGCKANYGTVYVICMDSSGAFKAVQGEITALDGSGNFIVNPELPANIPDTLCPIGYYVIKAGSTADAVTGWILGTNNSASVTGITYTLVDINALPVRPVIS